MRATGKLKDLLALMRDGSPMVSVRREEGPALVLGTNVEIAAYRPGEDPEGPDPIFVRHVHNRVTSVGRDMVRDLILRVGQTPDLIAIGTGTTAPKDSDSGLEAEVFRGTVTRRLSSSGKATLRLFLTTADANGFTLAEVGLFAGANYGVTGIPLLGGRLFARATFTPVAKTSAIQLTITWNVTISTAQFTSGGFSSGGGFG